MSAVPSAMKSNACEVEEREPPRAMMRQHWQCRRTARGLPADWTSGDGRAGRNAAAKMSTDEPK